MKKILGQSDTAKEMRKMLRNAEPDGTYLIGGEPGTGKGFLAGLIASKITKEEAEKNIIRVKKIEDFRKKGIVYITENRILFDMRAERFTSSLWLAPLRERQSDMSELIEYFIQESGTDSSFWYENDRINLLLSYWWPFNIQELKRVVGTEDGVKLLPFENLDKILPNYSATEILKIKIDGLFDELGKSQNAGKIYQLFLDSVESVFIESALKYCGGSVSKTADFLSVHRNTLTKKIGKLNIKNDQV
ncbi:hypothetical protein J6Z19_06075 [bacterium]|nr:hypothetical protein [bacterium]